MLFRAHFRFMHYSRASGEHYRSVMYESDTMEGAVSAFARWWTARQQVFGEHFHQLCYVEIVRVLPQRVGPLGGLDQDESAPIYKWKCDSHLLYGEKLKHSVRSKMWRDCDKIVLDYPSKHSHVPLPIRRADA